MAGIINVCCPSSCDNERDSLRKINELLCGNEVLQSQIIAAIQAIPGGGGGGGGGGATRGPITDGSGTISVGGTSQVVFAANPIRKYLIFQNQSSGDLWINFGIAAVQSQPSIRVFPGESFLMEGSHISTDSINVIGATTGQSFAAKQG